MATTHPATLRDVADLVVIGLVVVLNTTVGVIQEVRADRAVAAAVPGLAIVVYTTFAKASLRSAA